MGILQLFGRNGPRKRKSKQREPDPYLDKFVIESHFPYIFCTSPLHHINMFNYQYILSKENNNSNSPDNYIKPLKGFEYNIAKNIKIVIYLAKDVLFKQQFYTFLILQMDEQDVIPLTENLLCQSSVKRLNLMKLLQDRPKDKKIELDDAETIESPQKLQYEDKIIMEHVIIREQIKVRFIQQIGLEYAGTVYGQVCFRVKCEMATESVFNTKPAQGSKSEIRDPLCQEIKDWKAKSSEKQGGLESVTFISGCVNEFIPFFYEDKYIEAHRKSMKPKPVQAKRQMDSSVDQVYPIKNNCLWLYKEIDRFFEDESLNSHTFQRLFEIPKDSKQRIISGIYTQNSENSTKKPR